jgi:hypothetical protein
VATRVALSATVPLGLAAEMARKVNLVVDSDVRP